MEENKQGAAGEQAPARAKKKSKLITALAVIAGVIVALGVFLMVWYMGDSYPDFEGRFRQEAEIPALDDGFIPQGLGNNGDTMLVSGYMNDGGASRIYVIDDGETAGYVTIRLGDASDENGESTAEYFTGHMGGIATNGTNVWIASEGMVYRLSYSQVIEAAEECGEVEISNSWDANCGADFCYYKSGYLYVGEFYRAGNYETDESHRLTTPAGDGNTALILRYTNPSSYSLGTLSRAFSITGEIQGMAMDSEGDHIILSQSYGLKNSHILIYSYNSSTTAHNNSVLEINGESVTVYYLDSANLEEDYEIPCMSEGLCSDGDRLYVLFESASVKYRAFVRERLTNIYSLRLRLD